MTHGVLCPELLSVHKKREQTLTIKRIIREMNRIVRGSFVNVEPEIYCNPFFFPPKLASKIEKTNHTINVARLVVNLQK